MKKAFVSILQLYETNCTSKNIQWQASPPIDVMIKMVKNVLWENIEKVRMSVEHYCIKNDEQLLVNDFGIWPKNESRLIFSLIWCVNGNTYSYKFIVLLSSHQKFWKQFLKIFLAFDTFRAVDWMST